MKHTISKTYIDFPFAHRQHNHPGHCSQVHGHNWSFTFEFGSDFLDDCGFVIDFGDLAQLKGYLTHLFDHTLVLNEDDPLLSRFLELEQEKLVSVIVVPNCGAEGLGAFLLAEINDALNPNTVANPIAFPSDWSTRGVRCLSVTVHEDSKNVATTRLES